MRRLPVCFAVFFATLALVGCNGTISSLSIPSSSPWEFMLMLISSPNDDLVAVAGGDGLQATLVPGGQDPVTGSVDALVGCGGPSPYVETCDDFLCDPQAVCGLDPVVDKWFVYTLAVDLDRAVFSAGSVQVQDGMGKTQMGLGITIGGEGGSFDVTAGFSDGLIPGTQYSFPDNLFDEFGALFLYPPWPSFDVGAVLGEVCEDDVCSETVVVSCNRFFALDPPTDALAFATVAEPGTYSGTCGSVPISFTMNPPFASVGECISERKATACSGLTGQSRKTCNHAQIGICHATFNVASAHAGSEPPI